MFTIEKSERAGQLTDWRIENIISEVNNLSLAIERNEGKQGLQDEYKAQLHGYTLALIHLGFTVKRHGEMV